ncbi:MAG: leucine-rich repeat protein [Bacteroidaceae bacterium]|nr:leucine-rich repeat protein [Bacteroidaceae bacterium]
MNKLTVLCAALSAVLFFLFCPVSAQDDSFVYGDYRYRTLDNGCVELLSRGVSSAESAESAKRLAVPAVVSRNGSDCPVQSIAPSAFRGDTALIEVVLPEGLISVGEKAFLGCTSLKSVSLPSSLRSIGRFAFYGAITLSDMNIPPSVEIIGRQAFGNTAWWIGRSVEGANYINSVLYAYCGYMPLATHFQVPDGTISVTEEVFADYANLHAVSLPSSLKHIGEGVFRNCISLKSISLPDSLTELPAFLFDRCINLANVNMSDNVTTIGDCCFAGCTSLTAVTMPLRLLSGGRDVFVGCSSLKTVTFNTFVGLDWGLWFGENSSIEKIIIGRNVNKIPSGSFSKFKAVSNLEYAAVSASSAERAFEGMEALSEIVVSSGVKVLPDALFAGLRGLRKVTLPSSLMAVGVGCFEKCDVLDGVSFPESTILAERLFADCSSLTEITLPASSKILPARIFSGCKSLKSVKLPQSIETIGERAFENCVSLGYMELPENLRTTGAELFAGCESLDNVTVPAALDSMGRDMFAGCERLRRVALADGLTKLGDGMFKGCKAIARMPMPASLKVIGNCTFSGCSSLTTVTLPAALEVLGDSAFSRCALTEVTIPSAVKQIGCSPFGYCRGLKEINVADGNKHFAVKNDALCDIENTTLYQVPCMSVKDKYNVHKYVTVVKAGAFDGCTSLSEVTFGAAVKELGSRLFGGCIRIVEIKSKAVTPPVCSEDTFDDIRKITTVLSVPGKGLADYKAATGWSSFGKITD